MRDDVVSDGARQPMTPTERNRRYRQRRRRRAMVVSVEVGPAVVRGLRALGLLPGGAYDPVPAQAEVATAVEKLMQAAVPLSEVAAALYPGA
jgi:hypothetical protein